MAGCLKVTLVVNVVVRVCVAVFTVCFRYFPSSVVEAVKDAAEQP